MSPELQDIWDLTQQYIRSKAIANPNPALVWAADEATLFEKIVVEIEKAGFVPPSNFAPYDPAKEYSKSEPDFVSFNGNTYEYINNTPAAGKTPDTQPLYWKIASAGRFNHQQNTDTHTISDSFTIGSANSQAQEGWIVSVLRGTNRSIAHGYHFDLSQTPELHEFRISYNYTGDPYTSTWEEIGGGTTDAADLITGILADARLSGNIPRLNAYNEFTNFMLHVAATISTPVNATYVDNEESNRYRLHADGRIGWGGGIDDTDVYLERTGVGELEVSGKLNAVLGLQHKGADLLAYKTGTVVDFVAMETEYGTDAVPETGNITANITGAVAGHMAFMTHNNGTTPTFSSEFHKIAGSGDYATGQNNYIYFDYRSATRINYSITQ